MGTLCPTGQTVYVIASNCTRTIGAFTNNPGGTRTTNFEFGSGCTQAVTYNSSSLSNNDGAYYGPNVGYGNNSDCSPPDVSISVPCLAPETETFQLCTTTSTVSGADISAARNLFDGAATSVTIHISTAQANSGSSPITTYSGSTASTVNRPVRVVYANGCVVISTLRLQFVQPNVNAGNDNTTTICASNPLDLNSLRSNGSTNGGTWTSPNINFGNANSVDFSTAGAGTYVFTYSVTGSGNFCNTDQATFTVTVDPSPQTVTPDPVVGCVSSGNEFVFNLNALRNEINNNSGQTVNFYRNSNGTSQITNTVSYLSGSRSVYAIVGTGSCRSAAVEIELIVATGPTVVETVTNTSCFGGDDGAISLMPSGNAPFSYVWQDDPSNSSSSRTMLEAMNYFIRVIDGNGCDRNIPVLVGEPDQLMNTACDELTPATGPGAADGVARITVSGGTAPYTVTYENVGGTQSTISGNGPTIDISGLEAGTYATLSIRDNENCTETVSCDFMITAPAACFVIDSVRTNAPLCNGEDNGTIEVFTSGEGGPLVVNWSEGSFPDSLVVSNAAAGMYTVTLTDNSVSPACEIIDTVTVIATPALTISCTAGANASGPGNPDGTASIEIGGGRGPYSLLLMGNMNQAFTNEPAGTIQLNNLLSGMYSVMIMDANGCGNSCTFEVGEDAGTCFTLADETGFDVSCFGEEDATINIVVSDTVGPLIVEWSTGAPGSEVPLPQFDNQLSITVGAGEYSYILRDTAQGVNCSDTIIGIIRTEPDSIFVQCGELQGASSAIAADGIATFLVGGRDFDDRLTITGPVDTILDVNQDLFDLEELPAGTYEVVFSNGVGCVSETCEFTITSPGCNLMVDTLVTQISCAGAMDGAISVIVSGNTLPLTYTWNDSAFNGDSAIMSLDTGTYVLTITQDSSCSRELTINLAQPDSILLLCSSNQQTTTPLASDGIGAVEYSGGTAPYEIAINGGMISDTLRNILEPGDTTFGGLPVGVYNITVTDANGCVESCQFTIGSAGCPLSATFQVEDISCNGELDGRIILMVAGNNGPVTVNWSDPFYNGQQDINGLDPGDYSATITDAAGCTFPVGPISVNEPDELTLTCEVNSPVSVPNAMDGSAQTTITGGTAPFQVVLQRFITPTFSINDTIVTSERVIVRDSLSGGNNPESSYAFTVIDANGCTNSCFFTMFEPSCPAFSVRELDLFPVICEGDSTGRIEMVIIGPAVLPLTYEWMHTSLDTNILDNVPAGTYIVVVTDANGCTGIGQALVSEPTAPEIACAALTDESAPGTENGTAEVTLTGDVTFFTVTIMGPNDTTFVDVPDTISQVLTGLETGMYTVFATDSTGCVTDTCSFEIGQGMCALSAIADVVDQDCRGLGRVDVTVSNGLAPLTYDWSVDSLDGTEDVALAAGSYSLTVTDVAGCSDTVMVTIDSITADPLLEAMVDVTPADCSGNGSVDVTVTGNLMGVTYDWSVDSLDGMEDVNLAGGSYQLTVTEVGSTCQTTLPISVGVIDNAPTINFVAGDPVCVTESASIELGFTGNGPFLVDYQVAPNAPTQVSVTAMDTVILFPTDPTLGTSLDITVVSVTAANGCTQTINQTSSIAINYPDTTRVFETRCVGETINIGGIDFNETSPSDTFLVASAVDCGEVFEVSFNFIEATVDTFRATLCPGVPTELFGVVFDGNNPEQLVEINEPTASGCDSFLFVRVNFFPAAQGAVSFSACRGDTINEFGRIFTFEDNSGIVILEGASMNGCDSLLAVTVDFREAPEVRLRGNASICQGESTDLRFEVSGNGNIDVSITDQDGNIQVVNGVGDGDLLAVTPETTSTYSIVAANSTSPCPVSFTTSSVTVSVSRLSASLEQDIDQDGFQISCNGANDGGLSLIIAEGLPPYDIQWSNGAFTEAINSLGPGNYSVTLTDAAGCQRIFSEFIQEPAPLIFGTRTLAPDCNSNLGLIIIDTVFGGAGPYEISLDGEFYQQLVAFPYTEFVDPGTYTVFLQDAADCATSTEVFVPEPSESEVVLPPDTTIFLGDSLFVFAQTNLLPDTISWTPVATVSSPNTAGTYVTPLQTTLYSVYMIDSLGCEVSGDLLVTVDRRERIYVPNIFSPNSDGSNDLFRVFPGPGVVRVEVMQIFDRWGEKVYEALDFDPNDPSIGWDGTLDGTEVNATVFVFYLKARMEDGRVFERKGDLVLRRR